MIGSTRIYGPESAKPIAEIGRDDSIYCYDGNGFSPFVLPATPWSRTETIVTVKGRGREITISATDEMLVLRPGQRHGCRPSDPARQEWMPATDLKRGDYVVIAGDIAGGCESVDLDWARFLGFFVGSGTLSRDGRHFRLAAYGEHRAVMTPIVESLTGNKAIVGEAFGIGCSSPSLWKELRDLGLDAYSDERSVPGAVWRWNRPGQHAFLDGYCSANGHRRSSGRRIGTRTYTSTSLRLIADVRALHLALRDPIGRVQRVQRTTSCVRGIPINKPKPYYLVDVYPKRPSVPRRIDQDGGASMVHAAQLAGGIWAPFRIQSVSIDTEHPRPMFHIQTDDGIVADGFVLRSGVRVPN